MGININPTQKIIQNSEVQNTQDVSTEKTNKSIFLGKINSDGEIQNTKQGKGGDCWLLSSVNALRDTPWGKKLIKDSIKKDFAGNIVINLKGSRGEEKSFKITLEEIVHAKESKMYSSGDDDMIAIELAMEKYLRKNSDKHGREFRDHANYSVGESLVGDALEPNEIAELLSGEEYNDHSLNIMSENFNLDVNNILSEIETHPEEYAACVSFCDSKDNMYEGHAYQLKKVITDNNNKYVVVINPWDSSKEVKIPYDDFIDNLSGIHITENNKAQYNPHLKTSREKYKEIYPAIDKVIQRGATKEDFDNLISMINSDNIHILFSDDHSIKCIINNADKAEYGIGHGKNKKEIIAPLIYAYCEHAQKRGVEQKIIDDVKSSCDKELNALFYTDEKVIIEKLNLLLEQLKSIQ